ncbi:phosphoribosylanthranilate isomerase [Eionea flava]
MQDHLFIPRVKICGITCVDDALAAVNAGADAIGLVFYQPSPRYVDEHTASLIANRVGPFVTVVGLFVNASKAEINHVLETVDLHVLQFHGDESAEFCEQFHRPYMKAIRMKPDLQLKRAIESYSSSVGVLLDAYRKGVPGGTGETFDWGRVPVGDESLPPIILAGGLNPVNVADAINATSPYGVDVSGGVEIESHDAAGKKDKAKIARFIANAKSIQ